MHMSMGHVKCLPGALNYYWYRHIASKGFEGFALRTLPLYNWAKEFLLKLFSAFYFLTWSHFIIEASFLASALSCHSSIWSPFFFSSVLWCVVFRVWWRLVPSFEDILATQSRSSITPVRSSRKTDDGAVTWLSLHELARDNVKYSSEIVRSGKYKRCPAKLHPLQDRQMKSSFLPAMLTYEYR